jgi:Ca-activated chloride channel homolog
MIVFGITWAASHSFWTVILVGIAIALFIYRQYAVRKVVRALGGKWHSLLIRNFNQSRQYIKLLFFSLGCIALFLALLRPQWGKKEQVIKQKGRDILIALDISKSMLAQDCDPSRLEFAKKKIRSLLKGLESERVGLLLFSGAAFVQCPLTTDYGAFHMFLDHVDVETISSGSTAIDSAVQEAIKLFSHTPKGNNKLLLLCTDGEDFSSNLSAVKKQAEDEGVRIFTMGFGTQQGAPIPLYDAHGTPSGHQKDRQGKVVISQRNDEILQSLAHGLGGIYVPAVQAGSDIKQIVSSVQQIEKGHFEDKKMNQLHDRYPWFLFAALCAFLVEWIL